MHGLHLASSNFADPAALHATTTPRATAASTQQRMATTPNTAAAAASSSSSGSGATPSASVEKSESRGFFSKLFGRNKSTTSATAAAAAKANAAATPTQANTQGATMDPQQSAVRARSGAAAASAAVAATAPAAAASFRFPASLAGDRLEGLWRAWSSTGLASSSTSSSSGGSSSSVSATRTQHGVAEAKALLAALEEVEREWTAEPPSDERRKNRVGRMASPMPVSSPSGASRSPPAPAIVDPLSSLPLFRPSLHGSHGHPSALVRRLAQDFTQHTANSLPEQLATFIAQQQLSSTHSSDALQNQTHGQSPDLSPEADPDAPPPTLEQQLDQAPMFVLLQIVQHLLLYTNNRLILQSTDFFSWLVKLTAMLVNEYLTVPTPATPTLSPPASDHTSPSSPSAAQLHWARERQQPFFSTSLLYTYLHLQMQRCFMCIQLWMDEGQAWRRREMYTLSGSSSSSEDHRVYAPSLKLPAGSEQDQMLLRDALFQLFVHLHPHLIQRLHSPAMAAAALAKSHGAYTPPPSVIPPFFPLDLYNSLLHCFGTLAAGNGNNQEIFLQHSLHRRMLELIGAKFEEEGGPAAAAPTSPGAGGGWTDAQQQLQLAQRSSISAAASPMASPGSASFPPSPSASSLPSSSSSSSSFRWRWFSTQIWALEVLREVCFSGGAPGFTLEFVKNSGVERVLEMILWTFRAFSGVNGNGGGSNNAGIAGSPRGAAPTVERTAAATPAQIAAVQGLLAARAEEEKREMETEEAMHLAASTVPGSWMRSVSAALLRPENNPRCNTIYTAGCIVPASLLQSAPELHMLFNVLLSMCCMDLHADAASPAASPGPSPPPGRGVRSPVSPSPSAAVPAFNVSFLLLQMVLDLFNPEIAPMPYNQRARIQLGLTVSGSPAAPGGVQLHLPILQLQTLALFHRLLLYKPALLSFVRTYNVYHTLFAASFFFLSQVSSSAAAAAAAPTPSSSPPPSSVDDQLEGASPREVRSPEPVTTPQQHEALVSRLMRTSVLDLMAYFATLHGQAQVGSASPLAAPAAELSYLLSLLYQRYTSPSLVQQLCVVIKRVWQHRRLECEAALQQLCWQAHLAALPDLALARGASSAAVAAAAAASAASSATRPMDPFKQFSKLLAFFHQAMLPSTPSSPSHAAFLSMLETLLQGLPAQLLALREHGFVWSCFSMVESKDPRRRRAGIRMTISLVCAVGAAPDMLPALHAPPAILQAMGQQVGPPDLASASAAAAAPATPSRSSRARAGSMEDDTLGTPSGEAMSKDSSLHGSGGGVANTSLYEHEEIQKVARVLLTKYIELFPAHCTPSLAVLTDLAFGLHGLLTRHSRLHQDLCRRRHIFVQLMHILSHLGNAQVIIEEPTSPVRGAASMASPQALPQDQSYSISNAGGEGVSQLDRPALGEDAGEEGHEAASVNSVRTRSSPSAVIVASPAGAAGSGGALGMPLMIRSQTDSAVPSSLASSGGIAHSSALTLLLSLLRCLTLLLNNNLRSKDVFRKNIGNDLLAKLIHKIVVRETGVALAAGLDTASMTEEDFTAASEGNMGGATPAERCMRAIYGEIFRALLEREWSDIAAFERGFDSAALEGAVQPTPTSPMDGDPNRVVHSSSSAIPNRVYVFNSRSPPALLDCMLLQVLALQKSLLLPTPFLPEHEAQLGGGFLVCEDDMTSLRQFLENHGSILAVFGPSAVASSLAPPSAIQVAGSQGLPLVAYMLLSPLSEFEAPFAAPNPQCTLDLLVPRAEWNAFTTVSREQKRYIRQVGVVRDSSMRGAGTMLLRVAQSIYPRGLLSSVLAGPPPFVNIRSLRYFSDPVRGNFKQIGWDIVAPGPANGYPPALAGGFQCEVLQWSAEQENAAALARGYGKTASSSSSMAAPLPPLKASSSFPMPQIVVAASEVRVEASKRYPSASPSPPLSSAHPYVGDTSFVWIQNPDVIPLLFSPHLFLLAPLAVQRDVLSLFTKLVSTSLLNQSHACKVLLIDLLLDLFPHLPPLQAHADELVSLQRSFLNLIQIVGTHSISVKQLKRFFALMKSTPIRVPKEWIRMNVNQHLQAQLAAAASADGKGVEGGPPSSPSARDAWHSRESSASIPLAPPRTPSSSNVAAAVAASSMGSFDDAASAAAAADSEILEVLVRPWYGPLLLGAIEAMTSKSGPQDYWFLDGLSSGLTIPPLDRWPAKQGWAFSAWIRVESYEQPRMPEHVSSNATLTDLDEPIASAAAASASSSAPRSYQPRLFHFSSSPTGPFLESYFDTRGHLTLACCLTAGGPVQTQSIDFKLAPQTWYHVCMSQNVASTFGSSELIVWIDAQCVHTSSTLKYPAIPKQLSFCFVGTNQASSPLGGLSSTAPMPSSSAAGAIQALYGQLGPFYFFDEPVSSLQVGLMYALGPSYMFTFAPDTISVNASNKTIGGQGVDNMLPNNPPPRGGGKQQPPSITVSSASTYAATAASLTASLGVHARNLSSKIFLAYNSKARDGHLFLDNTPRAKRGSSHATASSRKRGMHAVALVGTYQCSTRHVAHVLTCLGGVSVLFPLLAQLDQPIHRERPVDGPIAENPVSSPVVGEGEANDAQMINEQGEGGEEGGKPGQSGEDSVPATPDTRKTTRRMRSPPASSPTSPAAVKRKLRSSSCQGIVAPNSELVYEVDRRFLVNFLHVLAVMLRQEANQTYMLSIHGFSVVGAQLELANPRHFTVKAVQALQRLVLGVRNHDILFRHAFAAFFTNLKLWIYAKPPVQRFWLCVTQEFVATYPALLNHALAMPTMQQMQPLLGKGTQHLLDRLRGVCWFNPNDVDGVGASSGGPAAAVSRSYLLHPVTQQVIGMRPSAANLREIRGELLRTLHDTLSIPPIGVSLPDIKAIVLFLQCCGGGCAGVGGAGGPLGDEAQIEDILWLFIQLMEKQSIVVLKYLAELDDLSFMSAASSSSSSTVTVSTPQPLMAGSNPASAAAGPVSNSAGGAPLEGSVSPLIPALTTAARHQPKYHYDSMRRAGMDIFLDLLYTSSSVRVRTLALRGLAKLLRSGSITSTTLQAEMFLVIEYALCGGLDGGRVVRPPPQPFLADMVAAGAAAAQAHWQPSASARRREWDESTYFALLSLMLGVHIDADNIREVRTSLLLEGATILHTSALAILLKLCAFHSSECTPGPSLLEIILQDMMFLLNHTTVNIKLCMDHVGWQEWFVQIMQDKHANTANAGGAAASAASTTSTPAGSAPGRSPLPVAQANAMLHSFDAAAAQPHAQDDSSIGVHPSSAAASASHHGHGRYNTIGPNSKPAEPSLSPEGVSNGDNLSGSPPAAAAPSASVAGSPSIRPSVSSPLSPSPHSEHIQSSINAQSYATSLFEQLLLHSLKKPSGYKHFDRMVIYLTFFMHPPVDSGANSTTTGGSTGSSSALLPRSDIPVLQFLLPVLQDLNQLLRRESETISQLDLGLLVDNIVHVLERTQDVLLERVAFHAHMHTVMRRAGGAEGRRATVDESGEAPANMSACAQELSAVWPLVEVMMVLNAWLVLFAPAHAAFKQAEREKEQARRGYISLLGSAAVGAVKGAAGAVSSATNATYRAIHDAFDMMNEPNVPTPAPAPAVAPVVVDESPAADNEMLFFSQLVTRIAMCFEQPEERQREEEEAAAEEEEENEEHFAQKPEGAPHHAHDPDASPSMVQMLFHGEGGAQLCAILSFITSQERAYTVKLASALRSSTPHASFSVPPTTPSVPGAVSTPMAVPSNSVASPSAMPSTMMSSGGGWMPPTTPGVGSRLYSSASISSFGPVSPMGFSRQSSLGQFTSDGAAGGRNEADALHHLYTLLCTMLDTLASHEEGASFSSAGPRFGSNAALVCPFVLLLSETIRNLHASSLVMLSDCSVSGSPSTLHAAWDAELEEFNGNAAIPPVTPRKPGSGGGFSSSSGPSIPPPLVTIPNPSASFLPALPPLPEQCLSHAHATPANFSAALEHLMFDPNWLSLLQQLRPLVQSVQDQAYGAHASRVSSLHRLGAKIRETHLRTVLNEQMPILLDSLSLVTALSHRNAAAETVRYNGMKRRRLRMARRRMGTWLWMVRNLTNERGPWSQNGSHGSTTTTFESNGAMVKKDGSASSSSSGTVGKRIYWKLDETENSSRMRMKLKINYRGHDHHQASHDYVAPVSRPASSKNLALLDTNDEEGSTSGALSTLGVGGTGGEDLFAAAILFSKSAMGVLAPQLGRDGRPAGAGSTNTEAEEDWDLMDGGVGKGAAKGKANDKGTSVGAAVALAAAQALTVVDTDVELITFRARITGRFMLTSTHLFFETRDDVVMISAAAKNRRKDRLGRKGGAAAAPVAEAPSVSHDRSWLISHICAVHFRRHQLRRNAIEIFFHDHTCVFFAFASETVRNTIHTKLLRVIRPYVRIQQQKLIASTGGNSHGGVSSRLANMGFVYAGSSGNYGIGGPWGGNAFDVIRKSGLVAAWRNRKISNFQYLMHLNTIAGRTYNDLTQYPVFPWVLADYTSSELDLDDPTNESGVFRDLTKPIGALNPQRLKMFLDRYHSLDDPEMPAFMYGTHYSSSGTVLFYLLRMEPFTTAAIELQGGKFEHADRMFSSVAACWAGVTSNAADVKELTPEFFYLPDFLRNSSGIDFGTKQRGEKIDDVILPPWAKGSADEFVRLNRAALESEYVSLNLHHWIDLIFGFKQLGRAAVEANNVFFHLTYEGGVDIDRIEDETVRDATIAQIEHFGQTPSQLFSAPHPTRIRQQEQAENEIPTLFQQLRQLQAMQAAGSSSSSSASSHHSEAQRLMLQLYTVEQVTATAATENPLLFLALLPGTDRLLTVALDRVMALHKFKNTIQEYIPPFLLEIDRKAAGATNSKNTSSMAVVAGATGQPAYAATMPAGGMMMPSSTGSSSGSGAGGSGGLGSALSFMSSGGKNGTASGRRVGVHFTVGLNILPFFFLVSADQRFLLSCGHWDNSFRVTAVDSGENVHSCSAHKDIVTCLAISDAGDYVVTGSKDTTVCVWQVASHVIDMASHPAYANRPGGSAAAAAAVSAAASGELYLLESPLHVLHGHDDEVTSVAASSELDVVVSGSRDGTVMLHSLRTGRYTRTISPPDGGPIRWVGVSAQGRVLSYSLMDLMLHAWSINGNHLGSCDTNERLYAMRFSNDGEFLLAGGDRKQLTVYDLCAPGGAPAAIHRLPPADATIRSIEMTQEEQHVLIGTATGKLYVYGLNADYLRKRFLKRLAHLGL